MTQNPWERPVEREQSDPADVPPGWGTESQPSSGWESQQPQEAPTPAESDAPVEAAFVPDASGADEGPGEVVEAELVEADASAASTDETPIDAEVADEVSDSAPEDPGTRPDPQTP